MSDLTFDHLVPGAPAGRFEGITRPYTPGDVERLRGSVPIAIRSPSAAPTGCGSLLRQEPYVPCARRHDGQPGHAAWRGPG